MLGFTHEPSTPKDIVIILVDITTPTISYKSTIYCASNLSGVIEISSTESGKFRIPLSFKSSVELVAWSWDNKYIAIVELGNSISVRVLELTAITEGKIQDEKLEALAWQLLFNMSSDCLFIVTSQFLYI